MKEIYSKKSSTSHHTTHLGELLDVVPGRRLVAQFQRAGEAVQHVAHGDVDRLAEYPVPDHKKYEDDDR